jgi:hypothetical protein
VPSTSIVVGLPQPKQRLDQRSRPRAASRACFEGILWTVREV